MKYRMKKPLETGCVFSVIESDLRKKELVAMVDAILEQELVQRNVHIERSFLDLISDIQNGGHEWRYYTFGVNRGGGSFAIFALFSDPIFDGFSWEPQDFGAEKWAEINEWFEKIR